MNMNQDAFRELLSKRTTGGHPSARPRNLIAGPSTTTVIAKHATTISASTPAFKPRKVKGDAGLRESESVVERTDDKGALEEIQRMVETLRSSAPSSGLEPSKHHPGVRQEDLDESLESAFRSSKAEPVIGKKRTREDIIRQLKEKTGEIPNKEPPEPAPVVPRGFKRVGAKEKKSKLKEGERQTKRTRRGDAENKPKGDSDNVAISSDLKGVSSSNVAAPAADPDDDIFADAGEWQGYGSSSDEALEAGSTQKSAEEVAAQEASSARNWFNEPARSPTPTPVVPNKAPTLPIVDEAESPPGRLVPLASSAVPSIRDLLALDKEETTREIRKAKRDARRTKQGLEPTEDDGAGSEEEGRSKKKKKTKEAKLNSEYQRVAAYLKR